MRVRGKAISRVAISILLPLVGPLATGVLHAATPEYVRARELYHRTAYRESLGVLLEAPVSTRGPGQPK